MYCTLTVDGVCVCECIFINPRPEGYGSRFVIHGSRFVLELWLAHRDSLF